MHNASIKDQAIRLRKKGYSYPYIKNQTGISKSTLSDWLSGIPYKPNNHTLTELGLAISNANAARVQKRQVETQDLYRAAKADIGALQKRDLFMFGLGLYLGEGAKTHDMVRITNSDPPVIAAAVTWFLSLGVQRSQFAPRIHLYPDSDERKCVAYWSAVIGVPKRQFLKSQMDNRLNKALKNRRKLPYGTLHLGIRSGGRKEFGVRFHRKITAWNQSILDQVKRD